MAPDPVRAVDCPDDLCPARADQPHKPQDLAFVQGKADVMQLAGAEVLHLQQRLADTVRPRGILIVNGPPDHLFDHLAARHLADRTGVDHAAVAHDGHDIAVFKNLVQLMADIDGGDAFVPQLVDDLPEPLELLRGQGAGGLVHDDEPGIKRQRLGDLHDLHFRRAQVAHLGVGADPAADAVQQRARLFVHAPHPAHLPEAAQVNVLAHRHGVDEVELLVDDAQPAPQRLDGGGVLNDFPVKLDGSAIFFVDARKDLHQRGFPRAVLAHDAVYDAGGHLDGDAVQRFDAGEAFAHVPDDEDAPA